MQRQRNPSTTHKIEDGVKSAGTRQQTGDHYMGYPIALHFHSSISLGLSSVVDHFKILVAQLHEPGITALKITDKSKPITPQQQTGTLFRWALKLFRALLCAYSLG